MNATFDFESFRRRLKAIMDRKGVKPTTLSLQVGKSTTLVKELLEKNTDTKISTIFKLAEALDVSVTNLLETDLEAVPLGPRLYLKGEVAAGMWVEAYEWQHDEWLEFTGRPDVQADPAHRFFLRVRGDSMDLVYPEGTLIECVSVFGRTEPCPGKRVVVIRQRTDQLLEATVKELVDIDGTLWFVPKSSNPAHQAFTLENPGDDVEEVRIAAVVVSSVRPE